jgi:hypothetical protein
VHTSAVAARDTAQLREDLWEMVDMLQDVRGEDDVKRVIRKRDSEAVICDDRVIRGHRWWQRRDVDGGNVAPHIRQQASLKAVSTP